MDRAAFVDERRAIAVAPFDLEHLERNELILVPRRVQAFLQPSPGVEAPVHAAHRAAFATTKVGPTSRIQQSSCDISTTRTVSGSARARRLKVRPRHADRDRLETRDCSGDPAEGLLRGQRPTAPVVGPLGPQHPSSPRAVRTLPAS